MTHLAFRAARRAACLPLQVVGASLNWRAVSGDSGRRSTTSGGSATNGLAINSSNAIVVDEFRNAMDRIASNARATRMNSQRSNALVSSHGVTRRTHARGRRKNVDALGTSQEVLRPERNEASVELVPTTSLTTWWEQPREAIPFNPAAGMIQEQVATFRQGLLDDRKVQFQRNQERLNRMIAETRRQRNAPPPGPVTEELPPQVVQKIFDDVVADPATELARRRTARVKESLAVHLEQMLMCGRLPCDAEHRFAGAGVNRIGIDAVISGADLTVVSVELCDRERFGEICFDVVVASKSKSNAFAAPVLEERLNDAAPRLEAALAGRWLVALAPRLRFIVVPNASDKVAETEPASPLWYVRRRQRRHTVHTAMQTWAGSMHW